MTRLATGDGTVLHRAEGINDAGHVTTEWIDPDRRTHPHWYLWWAGAATRIGPDVPFTQVADLSEGGQAVGTFGPPFGEIDAFTWRTGTWTQLDDGGGHASAEAVNDRGQIAGWRLPATGGGPRPAVWDDRGNVTVAPTSQPFEVVDINDRAQVLLDIEGQAAIWQVGGAITPLGTLGGSGARGRDVNDAGDVAGTSETAAGEQHAFVWHDGRMTDLGTRGGSTGVANAVNEAGQVVGSAEDAGGTVHAVMWDEDGRSTDLGTLGGAPAQAVALNERGQVVGYSVTPSGEQHAFLWEAGRMHDLNALVSNRAEHGWAADINERGQIVGWATDRDSPDELGFAVMWTARPRH